MIDIPLWERERNWPLMRPFVYYLVENFVEPSWVTGKRVVDFSTGLGDLTEYLAAQEPASLTATVPEATVAARPHARMIPGVLASRIAEALPPESVDLFCARMVFQFPRWEDERVDVDVMLDQIRRVLAPGGRIVIATHTFFPLQTLSSLENEQDSGALLDRLVSLAAGAPHDVHEILTEEARRLTGLTELVRYLGLPPRESPMGETGYGLRVPALVDSFVRAGFRLDVVDDVEPFTFPLGVWEQFADHADAMAGLGGAVFDTKRRWLTDARYRNPYERPGLVRLMLQEVRALVPIVKVPIVRVAASKPPRRSRR
jgi:SAM-dependent methyltransferase